MMRRTGTSGWCPLKRKLPRHNSNVVTTVRSSTIPVRIQVSRSNLTALLPTVGDTDPERIADEAERQRGPFRVFSFGIGYDVNTYLLDRLTERARGTSEYIQPGADIERAVGSLAAKIASPVMTDLALSGDGAELYDLQPASLPDLFSGDEIVLFGRY